MDKPTVVKPEPGCWYHSGRHLPPIGASVLVCTRDRHCWMVTAIGNEASRSLVFINNLAWQVPALPIDLFFEVGGGDYQRARFPMDMVFPRFKGLLLREIIDLVLAESGTLTTKDLTHRIYQTTTDEEFRSARNSLSTELRAGSDRANSTWLKIGRSAYAALQPQRSIGGAANG
jgi:hypothetical protein